MHLLVGSSVWWVGLASYRVVAGRLGRGPHRTDRLMKPHQIPPHCSAYLCCVIPPSHYPLSPLICIHVSLGPHATKCQVKGLWTTTLHYITFSLSLPSLFHSIASLAMPAYTFLMQLHWIWYLLSPILTVLLNTNCKLRYSVPNTKC